MRRLGGYAFLAAIVLGLPAFADEALWTQLAQGGYVLLIRHAATEAGVGDPPGFRLGDCATQRNLSSAGREQARRLGAALRERSIPVGAVRSSRWCRCLDTARLAFGAAEEWRVLDSLFDDAAREPELLREVHALAAQVQPPRNLVLVTHNVNIRALTGVSPATAEIIVTRQREGRLELVGRIPAP